MNQLDITILNLEKLRDRFGLSMTEIDLLAKFAKGKYSRIMRKPENLTIDDAIKIGALYYFGVDDLVNLKLKLPKKEQLPNDIYILVKDRFPNPPFNRAQKQIDIIPHATIILNTKFKVNNTFTNAEFKAHFPEELQANKKIKSIDWGRSSLSEYVIDTGETAKGKTKSLIIYKYIKKIPAKLLKNAQRFIDAQNTAK